MFSYNVKVYTTDGHTILNSNDRRINMSKDIIIGDHVWVGNSVMIMKGSKIPNGSIIGANSVVTEKSCNTENSIYAGNPAKYIKGDIRWIRELV